MSAAQDILPGFAAFTPGLPDRRKRRRDLVRKVKARHGIWTHRAGHLTRREEPWCALWVPPGSKYGPDDWNAMEPTDLISKYCRLLDEGGFLVTGVTEADAVRALCEGNKLEHEL